jgi:hypothetical protein
VNAGTKEFDLEGDVFDWAFLADELIKARLSDHSGAIGSCTPGEESTFAGLSVFCAKPTITNNPAAATKDKSRRFEM